MTKRTNVISFNGEKMKLKIRKTVDSDDEPESDEETQPIPTGPQNKQRVQAKKRDKNDQLTFDAFINKAKGDKNRNLIFLNDIIPKLGPQTKEDYHKHLPAVMKTFNDNRRFIYLGVWLQSNPS